jgi:hypothetical protein
MGLKRLGIKNPSANTDTLIYTADGMYLASIIATNKSTSVTSNVRIWVVPSGATLTSQYAYLAFDQDIVPQNTLETHRFALNQNDVVYVRADTANMSFMINGLKQVDLELDVSLATYSTTAPENPIDGMLWVDKDGNGTALDLDIYTKTEADARYAIKSVPLFSVCRTSNQTISGAGGTTILFDTKTYDTNNFFNTSTGRFTPTIPGHYQLSAKTNVAGPSISRSFATIAGPTFNLRGNDIVTSAGQEIGCVASGIMYFNGTTDFATISVYANAAGNVLGSGTDLTYFTGFLIRSV